MHEPVGMLAPAYVLGEEELSVDILPNRDSMLRQHNMPNNAELWGWRSYRRTQRSRTQLASASAGETIQQSGLKAADIDAMIICCGDGLNYYAQNRFITELAGALELRSGFVTWIGGAGCASLFSGVQVARSLLSSGAFTNVLVTAVDKIEEDTDRFQRFGVFSDGACSFIMCKGAVIDYAVLGVEVGFSLASLTAAGQDLGQKCQLIYNVLERLANRAGVPLDGSAFFGSNVFLPIQELEFSVMPVQGLITHRGNTARYGHCASADPIINLIDFYREPEHRSVNRALLTSTAHGHFGAILLEPCNRTT
jgi:3-oxoacyl-[acyl-carrier-protein] synthase III